MAISTLLTAAAGETSSPVGPTGPGYSYQGIIGFAVVVLALLGRRFLEVDDALSEWLIFLGAGLMGWSPPFPTPRPPKSSIGLGVLTGLVLGTTSLLVSACSVPFTQAVRDGVEEVELRRAQVCGIMEILGVPVEYRAPFCGFRIELEPLLEDHGEPVIEPPPLTIPRPDPGVVQ